MKKRMYMFFALIQMAYGIFWGISSVVFYETKWIESLIIDSHIPWFVVHLGWLPLFLGGLLLFHREK